MRRDAPVSEQPATVYETLEGLRYEVRNGKSYWAKPQRIYFGDTSGSASLFDASASVSCLQELHMLCRSEEGGAAASDAAASKFRLRAELARLKSELRAAGVAEEEIEEPSPAPAACPPTAKEEAAADEAADARDALRKLLRWSANDTPMFSEPPPSSDGEREWARLVDELSSRIPSPPGVRPPAIDFFLGLVGRWRGALQRDGGDGVGGFAEWEHGWGLVAASREELTEVGSISERVRRCAAILERRGRAEARLRRGRSLLDNTLRPGQDGAAQDDPAQNGAAQNGVALPALDLSQVTRQHSAGAAGQDSEAQEKKLRLVRLRRGKDLLRAALRVGSGRAA